MTKYLLIEGARAREADQKISSLAPAFLANKRKLRVGRERIVAIIDAVGPIEAPAFRRPTPQVVIEAVMYAVRTRGLAAFKEPANIERLSRCDAEARAQINKRIEALLGKKEILP